MTVLNEVYKAVQYAFLSLWICLMLIVAIATVAVAFVELFRGVL